MNSSVSTAHNKVVDLSFAYPLSEFYSHAKLPLPRIETIPGDAVPEPYKSLLVHNNDMRPTLEAFQ